MFSLAYLGLLIDLLTCVWNNLIKIKK